MIQQNGQNNSVLVSRQIQTRTSVAKERCSASEKMFFIASAVAVLWQFCPPVNSINQYIGGILTPLTLIFWLASCLIFLLHKRKFGDIMKTALPVIILFAIVFIKFVDSGAKIDVEEYWAPFKPVYITYTFAYGIAFGYSISLLSRKNKIRLLNFALIVLTLSPLPSYYYVLFVNSDAIRAPVLPDVINFYYIYSVIALLGLMLVAIKFGKCRGIKKSLLLICLIVNCGIIVLANFATAFLMLAATLFIGLIFMRKLTVKKFLLIVGVGLLIVFIFRNAIADMIIRVSESDMFSEIMEYRLKAVADVLMGKSGGSSFENRFVLMNASWVSFLQYPILGLPYAAIERVTVGFHETWLSLMAYSGIFGLILTIWAFVNIFKKILSGGNKSFKSAYYLMLIVLIAMSFLNPMIAKANMMVLFGIMPLLSVMFEKKADNKKSVRCGK